MENKDPYLQLIENALGKLTFKYKTIFKYELEKKTFGYTFTIYQEISPILFKELPDSEDLSELYYIIVLDFMSGGLERILMQRENDKKLFPKTHKELSDGKIHTTKSKW